MCLAQHPELLLRRYIGRYHDIDGRPLPTVLMARDDRGIPNAYYGRSDLVIPLSCVPLAGRFWEWLTPG